MLKSDLDRLRQMNDDDIDYSDIPPLTDEQLATMKPLSDVLPQAVTETGQVNIQLDADILAWLKETIEQTEGGSYQSLINFALRQYIEHQKEPLEDTLRRVIREELQTVEE